MHRACVLEYLVEEQVEMVRTDTEHIFLGMPRNACSLSHLPSAIAAAALYWASWPSPVALSSFIFHMIIDLHLASICSCLQEMAIVRGAGDKDMSRGRVDEAQPLEIIRITSGAGGMGRSPHDLYVPEASTQGFQVKIGDRVKNQRRGSIKGRTTCSDHKCDDEHDSRSTPRRIGSTSLRTISACPSTRYSRTQARWINTPRNKKPVGTCAKIWKSWGKNITGAFEDGVNRPQSGNVHENPHGKKCLNDNYGAAGTLVK